MVIKKATVSFFSQICGFFIIKDPINIIKVPLADIYTVDTHKGCFDDISFRTPPLDVQVFFAGEIDRKLFRDMIIFLSANELRAQILDKATQKIDFVISQAKEILKY